MLPIPSASTRQGAGNAKRRQLNMRRGRDRERYTTGEHSRKARQYEKLAVALFVLAGFFGVATAVLLLASVLILVI